MNAVYLKQLLIVGAGGFIGSSLRFAVNAWVADLAYAAAFPYGTVIVNVVGCLLIGILGGYAEYRQALDPALRLFLMVGLLGGFTTFSAYAFETLGLVLDGDMLKAAINVMLQVLLGIAAALAGFIVTREILS